MVVWLAIIVVVIIFIIIAATVLSVLYLPLLPLLLQVWVLEIFTELSMTGVLPAVNLFIFSILILRFDVNSKDDTSWEKTAWLMIGLVTVFLGGVIFGSVWEKLQLAQQYHVENTAALIGSPCRRTVTSCLVGDDISPYSGQLIPAIIGVGFWYFGVWIIRRVIISE
jgi:hypothetical protein